MDTVKILHISDLHLGAPGTDSIWKTLKKHIRDELQPHLVLVTGDLRDTPDEQGFESAKEQLDQIVPSGKNAPEYYRVCAGNHDRHPHGNALGFLKSLIYSYLPNKKSAIWFDKHFDIQIANSNQYSDFILGKGANTWRVRVAGLDTSEDARYSAQGFCEPERLESLSRVLKRNDDVDLVMVLLHHHLLPLQASERTNQSALGVLNLTAMLNGASTIESLAECNVNLVLHGHEHRRNVIRYGTGRGHQGEVVVLAAASATGMQTGKGGDGQRASVNLIELHPDRTVWVREVNRPNVGWQITAEPPLRLLNRRQIERARFCRRLGTQKPQMGSLSRTIHFRENRDIHISETRLDWVVDPDFRIDTVNHSGEPSSASFGFYWAGGEPTTKKVDPARIKGKDHAYRYDPRLLLSKSSLASRVQFEFTWLGGGLLTDQDLMLLPDDGRGDFRNVEREFASVRVVNELETMSLLIHLPADFAPSAEDVQVYAIPSDMAIGSCEPDELLRRDLGFRAPNLLELNVPYPSKGTRYCVTWKLPKGQGVTAVGEEWRATVRDGIRAVHAVEAFRSALVDRWPPLANVTIALYVPSATKAHWLDRVAAAPATGTNTPSSQHLTQAPVRWRQAWWGDLKLNIKDSEDDYLNGMVRGERAFAIAPVVRFGRRVGEPWGLVRVGVPVSVQVGNAELAAMFSDEILVDCVSAMLYVTMNRG